MSTVHTLLLSLFAGLIIGIMVHATTRRSGLVQYPFLAAVVMGGWVFPQLVGLATQQIAPSGAIAKVIFFSSICLLAGCIGYTANRRPARWLTWRLSLGRLQMAAAAFSLVGYYFWARVFDLAAEYTELYGGQWTGIITIYVFLGSMLTIGLAIAIVLHIHKPSIISTSIILFDLLLILERVLFQARREVMMELFVFVMLFLWWRYRWLPPRTLIICTIVFGTLVVNSVGMIRGGLSNSETSSRIERSIEVFSNVGAFAENLQATLSDPMRSNEMLNAALMIEGAERRLAFDGGANLWNRFVHSYVPGQIIGSEMKRSLMIPSDDVAFLEFGHVPHTGTTHTGIADAFRSFWYLGAGVFYLIGLIMSRWFRAADAGNPAAQMIVLLITTKSLLAITHTTPHFFLHFVALVAFLLPALLFSRTDVISLRRPDGVAL